MKQVDILQIEDSWYEILKNYFRSINFQNTMKVLKEDMKTHSIYPKISDIFNAYNSTSFEKVKVVIIGQDPYINYGEAHGLAFSVPEGIEIPPSLNNIFQELDNDLEGGLEIPEHGCLQNWANQGVLLLNSVLTVKAGKSKSHVNIGWQSLTNHTVRQLSNIREKGLIFLLWGNDAKEKERLIDTKKHYVLKAAHPSPYSASYGFFGCKHFSKTNRLLELQNLEPINWQV